MVTAGKRPQETSTHVAAVGVRAARAVGHECEAANSNIVRACECTTHMHTHQDWWRQSQFEYAAGHRCWGACARLNLARGTRHCCCTCCGGCGRQQGTSMRHTGMCTNRGSTERRHKPSASPACRSLLAFPSRHTAAATQRVRPQPNTRVNA